jgi:peptidoglycan/xylan/chitin deacetylase (PgdA/CDA1 family)
MNIFANIAKKIRRRAAYARGDLRGMFGMNRNLFRKSEGARIIAYHGVCRSHPTRFNTLFLGLSKFERHLQFYRKYFHVISLDDYFEGRFLRGRFNVCLTFDDGFANNYRHVLPLLEQYRVPAAFFITGIAETGYDFLWNDYLAFLQKYGPQVIRFDQDGYRKDRHGRYVPERGGPSLRELLQEGGFENKQRFIRQMEPLFSLAGRTREKDHWLQMTANEIRALSASPLTTIGCHGYTHCDLARMQPDKAQEDMARCRRYLENVTQTEIDALAFPYGSYTREVTVRARSVGFDRLLALDLLFPEDYPDPALRERLGVNPYLSLNNQMSVIIHGKYEF